MSQEKYTNSADVRWNGSVPERCEVGGEPIVGAFVDGATRMGPWAVMCPDCHEAYGRGLGVGRGQRYERQPNGAWLKTEG